MLKRLVLASMVAVCMCGTLAAQTAAPSPSKPSVAAARPGAKAYVPPKTAWGDPDIQGNYTNKYEQGTPFERPADLDGKTLTDISSEELADLVKKRQQRAIDNAPFLSGDPTGTIAGPMEFRDIYEVSKASRPWFVSDPPDGKIPAMLPEAQKRIAALPRTGSSFSNGVYSVAGSHTYADEGQHSVSVTVNDDGGQSATITGTATVIDAALTGSNAASVSATGSRHTR